MTSGWPDITGIDTVKASLLLGGDKNLFGELLRLFIEENNETVNNVNVLIDSGQLEQAYKMLHKLKGQAGSIGATGLQAASSALENAIGSGASNLNEDVKEFEQVHAALCGAVKLWLAKQTYD